jgi:hypothetical protein
VRFPTFNALTQAARETLARFPLPMLSSVFMTACLIITVESGVDEETYIRRALIAGLCFVASLFVDLLLERSQSSVGKRVIYSTAVLLAVVAYGNFIVPFDWGHAPPSFWYSYFILLFCLHLGIALTPLRTSRDKLILWRFNLQLFLRYFFSSINAALLFIGLALALLSIDKLFGLGIDDQLYFQLWFICAFFAHPLLLLGGIPKQGTLTDTTTFPKALNFTLRFVALPLTALYLTIIYTYVGKMAVFWSWPDGWVAMPIFILAVIGLLTYVLSIPLSTEDSWARIFHKWFFRLLFPLSIVLFFALQVRLTDYGMTINRHLGLTLAVWLFGTSVAYLVRPHLHVGWIPASLLFVSLFAIYGGPASATNWSQRAQTKRVRQLAEQLGAWDGHQLMPNSDAPEDAERLDNFRSSLEYVIDNFGAKALEAELAGFKVAHPNKNLELGGTYSITKEILTYLDLDKSISQTVNYYHRRDITPTFGNEWSLTDLNSRGFARKFDTAQGELSVTIDKDRNTLTILLDDQTLLEIDNSDWSKQIIAVVDANGRNQKEPLAWHFEIDGWRFSFVLKNANVNRTHQKISNLQLSIFYTPPSATEK